MLFLKRIIRFNEFMKCDASGEILMYGDFYYEDDETGKIISAKYYHDQKMQLKKETFDQSILENAQSQKEYDDALKEAEKEYLQSTMFEKPVFGKETQNRMREAGTWPYGENS